MGNYSSRVAEPTREPENASETSTSGQSCPVPASRRGPVYNVYNQRIDPRSTGGCPVPEQDRGRITVLDPRNNMPVEPNQQPAAGQQKALSTSRLQSSIPKGGTDTTWVYPSPQMFYNALKRKDKADDVTEDDMEAVVFAHNTMNEITWARVQQWELLHRDECGDCRLRRFMGRPDQLSPLARVQSWLGGQLPFDRHDWYVDRCGREVRYVIDFYFHEEKAGTPEAFSIRARPAVDSVEAVLDRAKMKIYTIFAKYGLPCPITGHQPSIASQGQDAGPEQQRQPA